MLHDGRARHAKPFPLRRVGGAKWAPQAAVLVPLAQGTERVADLKRMLHKFVCAVNEIQCSGSLGVVLNAVLQIGNLLNHGSSKAGAIGFDVGCLLNLKHLRDSSDGKDRLLSHLVSLVANEAPLAAKPWTEVKTVRELV